MMVCRNCGAEIDDKATSCPYCNAMQYDASEAEYMNNLYKMNSQMDNLMMRLINMFFQVY